MNKRKDSCFYNHRFWPMKWNVFLIPWAQSKSQWTRVWVAWRPPSLHHTSHHRPEYLELRLSVCMNYGTLTANCWLTGKHWVYQVLLFYGFCLIYFFPWFIKTRSCGWGSIIIGVWVSCLLWSLPPASDWLRGITWPGYWPLIGHPGSLFPVACDHWQDTEKLSVNQV